MTDRTYDILFLSLPLASLDEMTLASRLRDIGASRGTAPALA
ncbi:MAG: hypothetical protein ABIQ98_04520 [Sphingomicrobium sp.]